MMYRNVCAGLLSVFAIFSCGFSQTYPIVDRHYLDIGNRWEYQVHVTKDMQAGVVDWWGTATEEITGIDRIGGYTASKSEYAKILPSVGGSIETSYLADLGGFLSELRYENSEEYEECLADPSEQIPFEVNSDADNWHFEHAVYSGGFKYVSHGWEGVRDSYLTFEGIEIITVPAGTYECLKLSVHGDWTNSTDGWHGYEDEVVWVCPFVGKIKEETDARRWNDQDKRWEQEIYSEELTWTNVNTGDFNHDHLVDIGDLEMLAVEWLGDCNDVDTAPISPDGTVDMRDYGVMAANWRFAEPLESYTFDNAYWYGWFGSNAGDYSLGMDRGDLTTDGVSLHLDYIEDDGSHMIENGRILQNVFDKEGWLNIVHELEGEFDSSRFAVGDSVLRYVTRQPDEDNDVGSTFLIPKGLGLDMSEVAGAYAVFSHQVEKNPAEGSWSEYGTATFYPDMTFELDITDSRAEHVTAEGTWSYSPTEAEMTISLPGEQDTVLKVGQDGILAEFFVDPGEMGYTLCVKKGENKWYGNLKGYFLIGDQVTDINNNTPETSWGTLSILNSGTWVSRTMDSNGELSIDSGTVTIEPDGTLEFTDSDGPVYQGVLSENDELVSVAYMGQEGDVGIATAVRANPVVHFPDANLRQIIESGLNGQPATPENLMLSYDTFMNAGNQNICVIKGLEYCPHLTYLGLDNNRIADLTPLTGLVNLWSLSFTRNQVSNIEPLRHLKNLGQLIMYLNNVSDISPLTDLTSLYDLYIGNNPITDLSPLSKMTGLTQLSVSSVPANDFTAISNLIGLERLDLSFNQLEDISFVANLVNLTHLNLNINNLSDLSVLSGLTDLKELSLGSNNISNIGPLSILTNINNINLQFNSLTDISSLSNMSELKRLYIEYNEISDIGVVGNFSQLEIFYAYHNQISDISPLTQLTNLRYVDLGGNPLSDDSINVYIPQIQANNPGVNITY